MNTPSVGALGLDNSFRLFGLNHGRFGRLDECWEGPNVDQLHSGDRDVIVGHNRYVLGEVWYKVVARAWMFLGYLHRAG